MDRGTKHAPRLILAVDGSVGSGKTTMARRLCDLLSGRLVPEYFDMLSPQDHYRFRELTPTERLRSLLALESLRKTDIERVRTGVVLDRSAISLAAHEYAMAGIDPEDCVRNLPSQLEEAVLINPTAHVVLVAGEMARRRRCKARQSTMPVIFLSPHYNDRLYDYFRLVARRLPILFVDTNRAISAGLTAHIRDHIHRNPPIPDGTLTSAIQDTWPFSQL